MTLALQDFQELLPEICGKETSVDPDRWTPENPLWGHCAVVSLLANDIFGGTFLRASLAGTPFADARSHYWNTLPDGTEYDFTRKQFGDANLQLVGRSVNDSGHAINRDYLLQNQKTRIRYELLSLRLKLYLEGEKTES